MSTTRDIIRRALRLIGVLASGQEPGGSDAADGLERLQSLILGLPGLVHNAHWREVATHAAYVAKEGERITVTAPGAVTLPSIITWNPALDPFCDPSGLEWDDCTTARPPYDLARVQIIGQTPPNAGLWVYSASNAAWRRADGLKITSDCPFGVEDDGGLAAILAVDVVDEFGGQVGQRTLAVAQQSARSFRARFKMHERRHHHHHPAICDYS